MLRDYEFWGKAVLVPGGAGLLMWPDLPCTTMMWRMLLLRDALSYLCWVLERYFPPRRFLGVRAVNDLLEVRVVGY